MTVAKKEFSWDKETYVGAVKVSDKEERTINVCELNGKKFVAVQKVVFVKNEWKIIANATFPMNCFTEIATIVNEYITLQEGK
jgi:hypothetical protein